MSRSVGVSAMSLNFNHVSSREVAPTRTQSRMDGDCVMSDVEAQHEHAALDARITTPSSSPIPLSPDELTALTERMDTTSQRASWKIRVDEAANDRSKWLFSFPEVLYHLAESLSEIAPAPVKLFMALPNFRAAEAFANKLNDNQLEQWKEAVRNGVDNSVWTDLVKLFVPQKLNNNNAVNGLSRDIEGSTKRNITPTNRNFEIEVIDQRITQELKSLRVVVETFLKSPEPPTWVPPDYATPSDREFLASLRIPSYRNGNPSLLLHDLHICDGDEIEKIFDNSLHMCIYNTSGSGKTRRLLECFTKYWGFYLVAAQDANAVGVRDLPSALTEVTRYPKWISDLSPLSPEKRAVQSDLNSMIASNLLKKVLAARIVIFQLFLELAIQVDGKLQEKHKRIWLLFQLSDQLDPKVGTLHPFVQITRRCLYQASDRALDILIRRLDLIRRHHLPPSRFIIGLDEAQQAVRSYPYSFISSTNNEVLRSILCEIFKVFTDSPIKLVVSGTGLSLGDLDDGMASGVSKPASAVNVFHELGMFDTWPKLKAFIERYVPVSFLETPSGCHLQQRIREYLLGRYRFSVFFLEYFLSNGLQSPHKLLNEYIKGHTTCLPGDSDFAFTSNEPDLHITVQPIGFEWDRLQKDPAALQEAAEIVQSHLTNGGPLMFGPVTTRLVEYGIAHFCKNHNGQIVEPLAFLSLMKWLENQPTLNLQST